jgi:ribosomal protein S18 acetylase RimI-like enzyme
MRQLCLIIFLGVISSLFGVEKPLSMQDIEVLYEAPTAEEFVHLRKTTGMRERRVSSAEKAIKHALFWVTLRSHGQLIGMGRVVGDGGSFVAISDLAVHPDHQKKGLGRFMLETIQEYILQEVPDDAFVCLFANNQAVTAFYEQKGFKLSDETLPGMYWPNAERAKQKAAAYQWKEE